MDMNCLKLTCSDLLVCLGGKTWVKMCSLERVLKVEKVNLCTPRGILYFDCHFLIMGREQRQGNSVRKKLILLKESAYLQRSTNSIKNKKPPPAPGIVSSADSVYSATRGQRSRSGSVDINNRTIGQNREWNKIKGEMSFFYETELPTVSLFNLYRLLILQ